MYEIMSILRVLNSLNGWQNPKSYRVGIILKTNLIMNLFLEKIQEKTESVIKELNWDENEINQFVNSNIQSI